VGNLRRMAAVHNTTRETVVSLRPYSLLSLGFAGQSLRFQAFPIVMKRFLFAFMLGQGLSCVYFLERFASLAFGRGNYPTFKGVAHLTIPESALSRAFITTGLLAVVSIYLVIAIYRDLNHLLPVAV
jgi:hypothetical protein